MNLQGQSQIDRAKLIDCPVCGAVAHTDCISLRTRKPVVFNPHRPRILGAPPATWTQGVDRPK